MQLVCLTNKAIRYASRLTPELKQRQTRLALTLSHDFHDFHHALFVDVCRLRSSSPSCGTSSTTPSSNTSDRPPTSVMMIFTEGPWDPHKNAQSFLLPLSITPKFPLSPSSPPCSLSEMPHPDRAVEQTGDGRLCLHPLFVSSSRPLCKKPPSL